MHSSYQWELHIHLTKDRLRRNQYRTTPSKLLCKVFYSLYLGILVNLVFKLFNKVVSCLSMVIQAF